MTNSIRKLPELSQFNGPLPNDEWQLRIVQSDQCMSYVAWNTRTKEGLFVDPKDTDLNAYFSIAEALPGMRWVAVIDTHTHADHISVGDALAEKLNAPLVMHAKSPSMKPHFKVGRDTHLSTQAGEVKILVTPGHTPDSLTIIWGPYLFGGDTLLVGDVGRDDLPGGSPHEHYDSIQKIKSIVTPNLIVLPGHDHKGGRASTWAQELKENASLTQDQTTFIKEAAAFDAPAPELLKASLRENFK